MKSCLKTILSKKKPEKKSHINVDQQFLENCSSKCLKKMANLKEKLFENNSELKNSKEKLSNDVNIQFTWNSSGQYLDKTINLNEQFLKIILREKTLRKN